MALDRAREALTSRLAHLRRVGGGDAFGRLSEVTRRRVPEHRASSPSPARWARRCSASTSRRTLDDATFAAIREAFLRHGVIFFRDQRSTSRTHKAFASRFGTLFLHPNIQGSSADPAVIDIVRNPGDTRIIGEDWHSDTPQVPQPPMGSRPVRGRRAAVWRRHAVREPVRRLRRAVAGPQEDAGRRARAALRPPRRGPGARSRAIERVKKKSDDEWRETASHHPVVRTHPETGRKALYVNRQIDHRLREHDGGGEQAAARLPVRACASARVHVPLSLAQRLGRVLGQPLHAARRRQRHGDCRGA